MSVKDSTETNTSRVHKKTRRINSWLSLGLLTLLALPAVQPLLGGILTCGFDNAFHLWRAVQIEALLRQGVLFSRWAPHMAQAMVIRCTNFNRLFQLTWPQGCI